MPLVLKTISFELRSTFSPSTGDASRCVDGRRSRTLRSNNLKHKNLPPQAGILLVPSRRQQVR